MFHSSQSVKNAILDPLASTSDLSNQGSLASYYRWGFFESYLQETPKHLTSFQVSKGRPRRTKKTSEKNWVFQQVVLVTQMKRRKYTGTILSQNLWESAVLRHQCSESGESIDVSRLTHEAFRMKGTFFSIVIFSYFLPDHIGFYIFVLNFSELNLQHKISENAFLLRRFCTIKNTQESGWHLGSQ